jgi:CBS domain-containing protein
MLISDLLRHKVSEASPASTVSAVVTCGPGDDMTSVLASLAEHRIGAEVVVDSSGIVGIISERDIVRALHTRGASALQAKVGDLMTSPVVSCSPENSVEEVAGLMTSRRFRHMPVVHNGALVGIVTIGDVVAARIRQLEQDRGQLESYITRGS